MIGAHGRVFEHENGTSQYLHMEAEKHILFDDDEYISRILEGAIGATTQGWKFEIENGNENGGVICVGLFRAIGSLKKEYRFLKRLFCLFFLMVMTW